MAGITIESVHLARQAVDSLESHINRGKTSPVGLSPIEKDALIKALEKTFALKGDFDSNLREATTEGSIGSDFAQFIKGFFRTEWMFGSQVDSGKRIIEVTKKEFLSPKLKGFADELQKGATTLSKFNQLVNKTDKGTNYLSELATAIRAIPPALRTQEMTDFYGSYKSNPSTAIGDSVVAIDNIASHISAVELFPNTPINSIFEITSDAATGAKIKVLDSVPDSFYNDLANPDNLQCFSFKMDELHVDIGEDLKQVAYGGKLDLPKAGGSEKLPVGKFKAGVTNESFKEALKTKLPDLGITEGDFTIVDGDGKLDLGSLKTLVDKIKAEEGKDDSLKTRQKALAEFLKTQLEDIPTDLIDSEGRITKDSIDKAQKQINENDKGENKGFWFGGGVVNWGITLIAAVLAALGFKSADDSKKELKKAAQERMTQEAQIADVLRQVMATEQQDIASVKKSVNEVRYAIVRMKDVSTKRVAIKQKSKGKTRNNAPEGHEQANTTRMNAKSGQTKVRMNAEGDEEGGVPTDSMNDPTGANPDLTDSDLPPVDDGMNQVDENQNDGNDQVDGNNDVVDENQNDGNNQVGDEDGGDSAANSTVDGQPNSTRPMEGEGNNIVPKSKRVYISRGDGQPINVTKHAPAAVTTINFESDRYGNIPKKVTNKGGGDFDNE
jgi:hypothetical protein